MADLTYAEIMKKAKLYSKAVAENTAELPDLENARLKLDGFLGQAEDLLAQQAGLTASKQEVSKDLAGVIVEVKKILNFLKAGVLQRFGTRAEKLAAFGLQPFRSRPRLKFIGPDGLPLKGRKPQTVTKEETPAGPAEK